MTTVLAHEGPPAEACVYVLGSLRVSQGAARAASHVPSPGASRLLGYLAVTPTAPREEVAATLWPEGTSRQAGTALRTALTRLRQELGAGWIEASNHEVELHEDVWCDCRELGSALDGLADPCPDLERARTALRLYRGDAFRGWYEPWALSVRTQLRDQALLGYERLVEGACESGNWDLALEAGLSGIALEPLTETFHRGVMLAHGHRGNGASVIRQYNRIESLLEQELSVRPSEATRQALATALAAARSGR